LPGTHHPSRTAAASKRCVAHPGKRPHRNTAGRAPAVDAASDRLRTEIVRLPWSHGSALQLPDLDRCWTYKNYKTTKSTIYTHRIQTTSSNKMNQIIRGGSLVPGDADESGSLWHR
jgi:hypothetical protein